MAEERLRRNLEVALDPGPDFPSHLWLSRTMGLVGAQAKALGEVQRKPRRLRWFGRIPQTGLRFLAAVITVVLAIASLAVFLALHHPVQTPAPTTHGPTIVGIPSYVVRQLGTSVCSSATCSVGSPTFVSNNIGWLTEEPVDTGGSNCVPSCPVTLFRTDDGGLHWKAQVSWKSEVAQILASPDGHEVTVVGSMATIGSGVLHSTDGGGHWSTANYPPTAGKATQTICKSGVACRQQNIGAQLYFTSVREGWILSQEPSYSVADLFHTTDAGAHWDLTTIDVRAAFNVDLAQGSADLSGNIDHALHGKLVFADSSTGWFVSPTTWDLFVTHDGGHTWRDQELACCAPLPAPGSATTGLDSVRLFSDGKHGVISWYEHSGSFGAIPSSGYDRAPFQFEHTTSDGGDHWSSPPTHPSSVELPAQPDFPGGPAYVNVSIDFIDATHWVGWPEREGLGSLPVAGFMSTSDAGQHWNVLPTPPFHFSGLFGFVNPSVGWADVSSGEGTSVSSISYSTGATYYQTTDGGRTWAPISLPELR
jgi:photosystem II stability/assembly factor-like uncharacterized protein